MADQLLEAQDEKQEIIDPADLRKWRTELPNLYDDAGLDPYEFRLPVHYKRVGTCTQSGKHNRKNHPYEQIPSVREKAISTV